MGQKSVRKRGAGGRVKHYWDTFGVGICGNGFVDSHGNFQLQHHHIIIGDALLKEGDVLLRDAHVGTWNDKDAVFR